MSTPYSFSPAVKFLMGVADGDSFETTRDLKDLIDFLREFWNFAQKPLRESDASVWGTIGLLCTVLNKTWCVFADGEIVRNLCVFDALALYMKGWDDASRSKFRLSVIHAFDVITGRLSGMSTKGLADLGRGTIEGATSEFRKVFFEGNTR